MSYESKGLLGFRTALQTLSQQAFGHQPGSDSSTGQLRFTVSIAEQDSDGVAAKSTADKLNSEAALFEKSIQNADDGLDYAAVGSNAIDALADVTSELETLAEIASQNNISYDYRTALNDEAQALKTEYQRIKSAADYNTRDVLNNSTVTLNVKVGTGAEDYIPITTGQSENQVSFSTSYTETVYNGTLEASTTVDAGLTRPKVKLADIDGDNNLDLISGDNNNIYVQLGAGDGTYGSSTSYSVPSSGGSTISSISLGDANGDGFQDLIVTHNGATGFVGTLLNSGTGTFGAVVTTAETQSSNAVTGDFNGDGYDDIAYRNGTVNHLAFRLGNGDGTFGTETILVADDARTVNIIDVDGDGNLDILAGFSSNQFEVVRGNGDGTFQSAQATSTGSSVDGNAFGDFNRDGILDVAVSNTSAPSIGIYLGVGDGTFTSSSSITAPAGSRAITAGDFDGDGNQDLVGAVDSAGVVALWISNGDGTFKDYRTINNGTAASTSSIVTGDVDGDGADDVLATYTGVTGIRQALAKSSTSTTSGDFSLLTVAGATAAGTQFSTNADYLTTEGVRFSASSNRLAISQSLNSTRATDLQNAAEGRINEFLVDTRAENASRAIQQERVAALLAQSGLDPLRVAELLSED